MLLIKYYANQSDKHDNKMNVAFICQTVSSVVTTYTQVSPAAVKVITLATDSRTLSSPHWTVSAL